MTPEMMQTLATPSLSRTTFPLVALCLMHIETCLDDQPEAFEDRYLKFLRVYADGLLVALRQKKGETMEAIANDYNNTSLIWDNDLRSQYAGALNLFPDFGPIFQEMISNIRNWTVEPMEEWEGPKILYGLRLHPMQAWAIEVMEVANSKYAGVVQQIFRKQPVYYDAPSNFDQYLQAGSTLGADPFMELTQALRPFVHDKDAIFDVLDAFMPPLMLTVELFRITDFEPPRAEVDCLTDFIVQCWSAIVSNPLQSSPMRVRQHLSTINVRGILEMFCHEAKEILRIRSSSYLGWYMHSWFLRSATSDFVDPHHDGYIRYVICELRGWERLLTDHDPVVDYVPNGFQPFRLGEQLEDLVDMEDVHFRPVGPPLNPLDYADPVTAEDPQEICVVCLTSFGVRPLLKLRPCLHVLHRECLDSMINGVHASSNRCPHDRQEICSPRAKCAILDL
ncbi:hypothetical protein BU26DRAFT_504463 [Trematosphaeria pertusa]|uniref:RING-type domain-containing protein n=1 Tax=Trematosphaeria pertusa TaxID=390896 RepID=A0A6A6IHK5_9PLEO|nr:uncharacterized protein BU26DRAFT_504463 [Trematosphaeria pertusa]KAF2250064.1 hypothetical protein BU26DRAFT_504463 [Trematosphaeria pertusa]